MTVNLRTLSARLGLSETTVSRGLNGYKDVSEKTRKRIIAAAEEWNYSPNVRAKSLATGRSMVIGHVIPQANEHEMINPIFGDFVAGASAVYSVNGYSLLLIRVVNDDEDAIYRRLKNTGAVDGVVLQGPTINDERIHWLNEIGLPFIVHGRASNIDAPYQWLDVNNRRAFQRATQFLIDLGHSKIALLNGLEHMDFAMRRRNGFLTAFADSDLDVDEGLMFSAEMTEDFGYRETSKLLSSENKPTAIMTSSYITALGTRRAIEEKGLVMGKDISVITHDDEISYLPNGKDTPIFTCTRSSVSEAGKLLANMLIEQINNPTQDQPQEPTQEPANKMLEAELVIGQSTGPCRVS